MLLFLSKTQCFKHFFYVRNISIFSKTETDRGYVALSNSGYKYPTLKSGSEDCGIDKWVSIV